MQNNLRDKGQRGGVRPGAGRPVGSKNQRSAEKAVESISVEIGISAFDPSAHRHWARVNFKLHDGAITKVEAVEFLKARKAHHRQRLLIILVGGYSDASHHDRTIPQCQ